MATVEPSRIMPTSPSFRAGASALVQPRYLLCLFIVLSTLLFVSVWQYGDSSYIEWIYPSGGSIDAPIDDYDRLSQGLGSSHGVDLGSTSANSGNSGESNLRVDTHFSDGPGSPSIPPYPADEDLPGVYLFLPVDKIRAVENPRFCRALQGAVVNGWRPIIFNWDVEVQQKKAKPFGLAKILNSPNLTAGMKESDLIFTMDALDVWLQLSPRVLARRFLEYDEDLLVAAEKNCFPNARHSPDCMDVPPSPILPGLYLDNDKPHTPSPLELTPTHANSGTIVGRLDAMREFHNNLTEYLSQPDYWWYDDQGGFNYLLSQRKIKLDYYNRLFWPAHDDFQNFNFIGTRYPPDPSVYADSHHQDQEQIIPWALYPPLGHHSLNGQVPIAIHFNGGAKEHLEEWWGNLWWNSERERFKPLVRKRMDNGRVRIVTDNEYREESVRELCPMLKVWYWKAS